MRRDADRARAPSVFGAVGVLLGADRFWVHTRTAPVQVERSKMRIEASRNEALDGAVETEEKVVVFFEGGSNGSKMGMERVLQLLTDAGKIPNMSRMVRDGISRHACTRTCRPHAPTCTTQAVQLPRGCHNCCAYFNTDRGVGRPDYGAAAHDRPRQ